MEYTHTHTQAVNAGIGAHTQCIRYKHRKCFGSLALAAGGPGWDRVGCQTGTIRRREQASNTNQGDLVMDAGLTESPFMFGLDGSANCSPISHLACMSGSVG